MSIKERFFIWFTLEDAVAYRKNYSDMESISKNTPSYPVKIMNCKSCRLLLYFAARYDKPNPVIFKPCKKILNITLYNNHTFKYKLLPTRKQSKRGLT